MDERIQVYETKMKKTLESLERDYISIRAGRANPHVLDKLVVDYYGTPTPIQHFNSALGIQIDQSHRKRNHGFRYRYHTKQ